MTVFRTHSHFGICTVTRRATTPDYVSDTSNLAFLETFRDRLLDAFEGRAPNFEGAMANYLGCEIQRNRIASTTCLSQRRGHYAEDVLCTFSAWNSIPALTVAPMRPNTRLRLSKDDCDLHPDRAVHDRYRDLAVGGSQGYQDKDPPPRFCLGLL
jgi:hypothetical protein